MSRVINNKLKPEADPGEKPAGQLPVRFHVATPSTAIVVVNPKTTDVTNHSLRRSPPGSPGNAVGWAAPTLCSFRFRLFLATVPIHRCPNGLFYPCKPPFPHYAKARLSAGYLNRVDSIPKNGYNSRPISASTVHTGVGRLVMADNALYGLSFG